jgi:hypothetical protein
MSRLQVRFRLLTVLTDSGDRVIEVQVSDRVEPFLEHQRVHLPVVAEACSLL